jgi:hypothetical protein
VCGFDVPDEQLAAFGLRPFVKGPGAAVADGKEFRALGIRKLDLERADQRAWRN